MLVFQVWMNLLNSKEKAATIEGLIKSTNNRHEKDDRPHTNKRENYVLGWDNKENYHQFVNWLKTCKNNRLKILKKYAI